MINTTLLDKLVFEVRRRKLDAFFAAPSAELTALIGISPFYCFRIQGLLVCKDGRCAYLCNCLSADEISKGIPDIPVYAWHDNTGYLDTVHEMLREFNLIGGKIGVNKTVRAFDVLSIMEHMSVSFTDAGELFSEITISKSEQEIAYMRDAARIAGTALKETIPVIHPGMTEQDLRRALIEKMRSLGGEAPEAMIASGPNSGYPHYFDESRTLQMGDTVLIDYGCAYHDYRTDITRMVYLGEMNDLQKEIFNITLKANRAAISAIVSGERWIPSIDSAARTVINDEGYGENFTTRLGHGIGVMGHESPDIKAINLRMLEGGMTFSIEPGIYLGSKGGARVEDCVCILPSGVPEVLTDSIPRDPIVLLF